MSEIPSETTAIRQAGEGPNKILANAKLIVVNEKQYHVHCHMFDHKISVCGDLSCHSQTKI